MHSARSNIVLIGMPGAGKSTLGVVLAKILNKSFIDVDLVIQTKYGKTLQQLIDENGAKGFIELEGETLCDIQAENAIIATGGSAVYSEVGMAYLASIATVVYLRISYDSLVERLGDLQERGVVMTSKANSLKALYDERRPLYERYAEITVDVDSRTISEAAKAIATTVQASTESTYKAS